MEVRIIRSAKRRKTVSARLVRIYPKTNRREGGTFLQTAARSEDEGVADSRELLRGRATQPQEAKMSSLPTSGFGIDSEYLIVVNAPCQITESQLEKIITRFKEKFQRRKLKEELNKSENLFFVFSRLNAKYFENKLKVKSIEYATNQNSKFGCCDYRAAAIRISHRLSAMPVWVRDYVIVHEMAHLLEQNHSQAFWALVSRYELAERARGYLMAVGFHQEEEDLCEPPPKT